MTANSRMPRSLAFFVGAASAPNVRRLVSNFGWMLSDLTDLHLVTTDPDSFDTETLSCYDVFGRAHPSTTRGEFAAVNEYLRESSPGALMQLTFPPLHGTIAGLAAKRFDVPFVYRYNGDRFTEYTVARGREKVLAFGIGNVLGRVPLLLADHYVTLGPRGTERLTEYRVDLDSITELPPSIDVNAFRMVGANPVFSEVPAHRRIVLFVGRLSHLKGAETLERTIPSILTRRSDLQFAFVGDPEQTLSVPSPYKEHVTVVGHVPPEQMAAYYGQADLLVHPSLTEGIPRAVLESLASGTPVLARDVGDVAAVTDNTFTTDEEFVEQVLGLEDLQLDSVEPFARETLRPTYRLFFEQFTGTKTSSDDG